LIDCFNHSIIDNYRAKEQKTGRLQAVDKYPLHVRTDAIMKIIKAIFTPT